MHTQFQYKFGIFVKSLLLVEWCNVLTLLFCVDNVFEAFIVSIYNTKKRVKKHSRWTKNKSDIPIFFYIILKNNIEEFLYLDITIFFSVLEFVIFCSLVLDLKWSFFLLLSPLSILSHRCPMEVSTFSFYSGLEFKKKSRSGRK